MLRDLVHNRWLVVMSIAIGITSAVAIVAGGITVWLVVRNIDLSEGL